MYRIKLTARAKKELKNIRKRYVDVINAAFEEIRDNPHAGKLLTRELIGKISYKIGVYRLIYTINEKDKIITILTADHRSRVYK